MSGPVGFVVDRSALGQVLSMYFGFPCQSFYRLLHTHLHLSSGAGTVDQTVADAPSGVSLTQPKKLAAVKYGKTVQALPFKYYEVTTN
jgi:hypothetical protein